MYTRREVLKCSVGAGAVGATSGGIIRPASAEDGGAGDILFFRGDLWHSGSENRTADQVRYLLQVQYGRRGMAQHFAPYLEWCFNPEVVAACTPRQRRLLGDHRQGAYD
jgi:hypothetical protein